ncbi:MAG: penicillin-binding transpeptidase domain-containing protein [Acidobacteriia bacterium]|nr:penicillin-binding transpeptidase domain-containing protein [Terriglobia bacterium]
MTHKLARLLLIGFISLCMFFEVSLSLLFATRTASSTARHSSASRTRKTANRKTKTVAKSTKSARTRSTRTAVARRRRIRPLKPVDPTIGDNPLGEDPVIRSAAVEALGKIDGSIVVVDPSNGRILTMVNQKVALGSGYQPCSTFKLAITLAGLSEGVFSKDSEFRCPSRGYLNFTDAFAYSCNDYFQNVGQRLGFDRVKTYAKQFGFGELAGYNIKGEHTGIFPNEISDNYIRLLSSHGMFIEATPLEMAALASAIANGGTLYYLQYPRKDVEINAFEPRIKRKLEISALLPDLKEGMSGSVTYGSGRRAYDPLEPVYGKTGSCSDQGHHLGWFVSYAGDSDRKLVAVVLIRWAVNTEGPYAAMVAGRFYRELSQQNYFVRRDFKLTSTSANTGETAPVGRSNLR